MKTKLLAALLAFISCNKQLRAENAQGATYALKTGAYLGTVSKVNSSGETKSYLVGGIPMALAFNREVGAKLEASAQGKALIDLVNNQILRQSVELGIDYHLMGGFHHASDESELIKVTKKNRRSLSLLFRAGLNHYTLASKEANTDTVTGSVLEFNGGVGYRQELTERSSWTIELVQTLFTIPASAERVKPSATEILLGFTSLL